jgi:ubiquinol-cytochrome c reductase cytochrome c1 subunit
MKRLLIAAALALGVAQPALAAGEAAPPPRQEWSFNGIFGTFDRAELQRGFQVFQEVCAGCHGLSHVAYRDLADLGFSEEEVKAIAAQKQVPTINDEGEEVERPAIPADKFVPPFPNEQAARAANNGAFPPDLSLITKARAAGPDYVAALLAGYEEPPADFELQEGMQYNKYFPGHQIAMPAPLFEDAVTFADGTPATVPQMARDVAAFLHWAAEPNLEERHQIGLKVMLFLLATTVIFYAAKRRIWAELH